ncbi:hypothetical protein AB0D49_39415 [Streptomyces sp. NPDC048290]|uniref:hypothetical protein n=1 Tax=Streptomyces sp. NPDC048290 TaxID=3155811 RepID=UPI003446954A
MPDLSINHNSIEELQQQMHQATSVMSDDIEALITALNQVKEEFIGTSKQAFDVLMSDLQQTNTWMTSTFGKGSVALQTAQSGLRSTDNKCANLMAM